MYDLVFSRHQSHNGILVSSKIYKNTHMPAFGDHWVQLQPTAKLNTRLLHDNE